MHRSSQDNLLRESIFYTFSKHLSICKKIKIREVLYLIHKHLIIQNDKYEELKYKPFPGFTNNLIISIGCKPVQLFSALLRLDVDIIFFKVCFK